MKALIQNFATSVAYFFILLFIYASVSKILDFENFQIQLAQSPLLSVFAESISYSVILTEVLISALLAFPKTRKIGLYFSFGLMLAFTVYIYIILNYSDFIPCSCGGILEKMSWSTHLLFNIVCVALALLSIIIFENREQRSRSKVLGFILLTSLISSGAVIALFLSSEKLIKKDNNFTRRYPQHPILEQARYDLQFNSYYFAGYENDKLFLGNSTSPLLLTSLNKTFSDRNETFIRLQNEKLVLESLRMKISSNHYYIYDGSIPVIYRGILTSPIAKSINYKASYFNQFIIVDSMKFGVRTIISKPKHFALGLINQKDPKFFTVNNNILDKEVKSLFETDGSLITDPLNNNLIYIYRYQSKFVVVDQDLKQPREYQTIDATPHSILNIKTLKNGDKHFQSTPPQINKTTAAFGGVLFIESNLKGKFESSKRWNEASVIDMYSTNEKEYFGSFYINHPKSAKLSEMLITDKFLFVIIGNDLVKYQLSRDIKKHFKKGSAENLKKSRQ